MASSPKPSPALKPRRTREAVRERLTTFVAAIEPDPSDPLHKVVHAVIDDPRFWDAPASAKWHHNYDGGLAEHTLEVLEAASSCCLLGNIPDTTGQVDPIVTAVAALWHDYAKILDYVKLDGPIGDPSKSAFWVETPHHDRERHLVKSYAWFLASATRHGLNPELTDAVAHCLLAHHGRRDWGSPVEPQTPEAWALHLADMISVRVLCNRPE